MSIPSIINVFLVCFLFWLVFAVCGVQVFAGTFSRCVDASLEQISDYNITDKAQCLRDGYLWRPYDTNFDNLGNALLALLHIATLDGWTEIMRHTVEARGVIIL